MKYPMLLNVNEVTKILRLSKISVYRMVDSGDLAAYKFKGSYRFKQEDIDAYLEKTYKPAKN